MPRSQGRGRYLQAGTTLHGAGGKAYRIEPADTWKGVRLRTPAWVIGAGGFGITYRVVAEPGGAVFALKEYFPEDFAERASDGRVSPRPDDTGSHGKLFAEGLRKFSNEAQYLQELQHPNICRVTDAFMANGTAYYVTDLVEGRAVIDEAEGRIHRRVTLHDYLSELEGRFETQTLERVRPLVDQLLDAVEYIHTEGPAVVLRVLGFETRTLLHRDIKPSNILVRPASGRLDADAGDILADPDTLVQLIDFGSARGMAIDEGEGNTKSIAFITDSYAPPELKDNRISEQGPQSDIYSLAATFWRMLIGKQPAMTDLIAGARAVSMGAGRAPASFLSGMDRALQMDARSRPQSVAEWRGLLFRAEPRAVPVWEQHARNPRNWAIAGGVVVVGAIAVWGIGQMSGPTDHVYREADVAYQAALADVELAQVASSEARRQRAGANAASEEGFDASLEAVRNMAAKDEAEKPKVTYNDWVPRITDGSDVYSGYCRPDPNGTFTRSYSRTTYYCSRYLGATTTRAGGTYTGPTSPWRIDLGSGTFQGHVDGGQPVTAGALRDGEGYLGLRIESVDGTAVVGVGTGYVRVADSYRHVAGKTSVNLGQDGLRASSVDGFVAAWPTDSTGFLGQWRSGAATGSFKNGETVLALGRRAPSGRFSGRMNLEDGRSFVGVRSEGEGFWWGALLRNGAPYYLGQVRDGNPDGCGVRIGDDGKRRGVYLVNGLENPDAFRSECREVSFSTGAAL
ncbi:serine/threonine-protein kinase [Brevundimonas lenta]|uniref:Serine/threonine protein kinase n=1 Tax=Brevundimonas lenta TaxID=424796 RepID=A0A7W6JA95_9CAUL|nr:serine/threonine-protein kinase [Brevundimonas lenta]MBB4081419.1 serine/threonine protein kinase [Brevundimonas lenta]